jgi:hypothetical protein
MAKPSTKLTKIIAIFVISIFVCNAIIQTSDVLSSTKPHPYWHLISVYFQAIFFGGLFYNYLVKK